MKRSIVFGLVLALVMMFSGSVMASSDNDIRVMLGKGSSQIINIKSGNYNIEYMDGTVLGSLSGNNNISVNYDNQINMVVNGSSTTYTANTAIYLVANSDDCVFSYANVQYRGDALFIYVNNNLFLVNQLPMEQYLYGVIGKEIGYNVPYEALKAQAVASRSYAQSYINASRIYDVAKDTSSQVYGGYTAETATGGHNIVNAVDDTYGEVMYHNGTLVVGYFHANAGGYTENSENVWSSPLSYVKGVKSSYDGLPFVYNKTLRFPYAYNWTKTFTWSEIESTVQKYADGLSNPVKLGKLKSMSIIIGGTSGRVEKITFNGTTGSVVVTKSNVRAVLGIKSTLFSVIQSSNLKYTSTGNGTVNISKSDIDNKVSSDLFSVTFKGRGSGHGLGMSQWGAMVMAYQGKSFYDILDLYYNQGHNDGVLTIEAYKGNNIR